MVSFVGAGPGAEDLITVRGMRLLEQADVIIYAGSLVSDQLLNWAKADCEIYNSATMSLDEVIAVMQDGEKKNLNTVRLHTGDPSVYGAIREQLDRLDELGISYEIVPGVSSFCGAAAALKAEYTLPGISQSVIITRMEGRTAVPPLERISEFAKHQATMVIFLSASMMDLVQKELMEGGYDADTPAAIIYKATWPEEKVLRCTVGTLHQCATENHIKNHALIAVGYFLGKDYELSKLYDSGFSTGFREASSEEVLKVSVISFSDQGEKLAHHIADVLKEDSSEVKVQITDVKRCESGELKNWSAEHFRKDDALIFVGACGIATRAIAPYVHHKTVDPAVIVVDELGRNVIPLLSGHIGGANRLSEILAERLTAEAKITTATDLHGSFAVDTWAKKNGMTIHRPEYIKVVSSKALKEENIIVESDVKITYQDLWEDKLTLIPKVLSVGIGCKKGTAEEDIENIFEQVMKEYHLAREAVKQICSIDLKEEEPGLISFAKKKGIPFVTFSAEALQALSGDFSTSEFVKNVAGVDCVCERSAVKGAGETDASSLIVRKTAANGVTIAVAVQGSIR